MTGAFVRLRDDSEAAVHAICDELAAADPATLTDEQVKISALYGDFMDAAHAEELDDAPLADLLERVDQIDSVSALQSYFGWSLRYGITSLWGCDVESDPGDPTRYAFFVAQDGIGLPDESYYREEQHAEILAEYSHHVARTLELAGLEDAEQQAADVVALEKAIAACHWDVVRTRDLRQMYNPRSVAELHDEAPEFGWDLILDGASIDGLGLVVDCQPSFFVEVAPLFPQFHFQVPRGLQFLFLLLQAGLQFPQFRRLRLLRSSRSLCRNLLPFGLEFCGDLLVNGILCLGYLCLLLADRGFAVCDIGLFLGDLLLVPLARCLDKRRSKRLGELDLRLAVWADYCRFVHAGMSIV